MTCKNPVMHLLFGSNWGENHSIWPCLRISQKSYKLYRVDMVLGDTRELKQRRRRRQRERHYKIWLLVFVTFSWLFQFVYHAKCWRAVQGLNCCERCKSKEKERKTCRHTFTFSRKLKFGHFMLLFCRGRERIVPKCKTHVQRLFLLIKPIVLWSSRCRPRCLSSLVTN